MTEREDIEDMISRLGSYIDSKEWKKLEDVLGDKEVITNWKSLLSSLQATQHIIGNMLVTISGNNNLATCTANVLAVHVRRDNLGDSLWTVGGRYDFKLEKLVGRHYCRIVNVSSGAGSFEELEASTCTRSQRIKGSFQCTYRNSSL